MPCTPPPGGVADEHRTTPRTPSEYGSSAGRGRSTSWRSVLAPDADVAADVVRVVRLQRRGVAGVDRHDPLAEARGEALDLGEGGLGGVPVVGVRHVRVQPQGVDVTLRAGGVGEVLLAHQDERALRHHASGHGALGRGDLRGGPAEVQRAGATRVGVGPGHATLHGEVDLERRGAVAEASELAPHRGRHPRPQDAYGGVRRGVEDDGRGALGPEPGELAHLVEPGDVGAGDHPSAEALEQGDHRGGDRLAAALGHRPAGAVPGRAEEQPDRAAQRRVEPVEGVRGDPHQQRPRRLVAEHPGQHGGREGGAEPEPDQGDRVPRHVQHRSHRLRGDVLEVACERSEQPLPARAVGTEGGHGRGHVT